MLDIVDAQFSQRHLLSIISDFLHLPIHHVNIENHFDELFD